MPHYLSEFLQKKGISPEKIYQDAAMVGRSNQVLPLENIKSILRNEKVGLSIQNIQLLDAHYQFSDEEKKALYTMVSFYEKAEVPEIYKSAIHRIGTSEWRIRKKASKKHV